MNALFIYYSSLLLLQLRLIDCLINNTLQTRSKRLHKAAGLGEARCPVSFTKQPANSRARTQALASVVPQFPLISRPHRCGAHWQKCLCVRCSPIFPCQIQNELLHLKPSHIDRHRPLQRPTTKRHCRQVRLLQTP